MPFSTFMDNAILNEFFGGTNYVPPANVFIGLSTSAPAKAGTGVTEPVGNGYARVTVVNNATNFPNASGGVKSNGTVITFPEASGNWGNITHFVVYDALTGGNLLMYGTLTTPKTFGVGDIPSFIVGALSATLT